MMKQYSEKETRILDTAAELFANQPFHKVLLSDVARVACVGKGTLYLYFKSKDDLYFAVLLRGFATLVAQLEKHASQIDLTPTEQLTYIITDLAQHLLRKSINAQLLGRVIHFPDSGEWQDMRAKLWSLIESVIVRGIDKGDFEDSIPRLTAQYIPSLIRSISLFPPEGIDIETFCNHACTFVFKALEIKK